MFMMKCLGCCKDKVRPSSCILKVVMMINYLASDIEVLTVTEMKVSRDDMSGSLTRGPHRSNL